MTRKRRAQLRVTTLKYLGDLLTAHPDGDNGLWDDVVNDEETEFVKQLTLCEGQKLVNRSRI